MWPRFQGSLLLCEYEQQEESRRLLQSPRLKRGLTIKAPWIAITVMMATGTDDNGDFHFYRVNDFFRSQVFICDLLALNNEPRPEKL